MCLSREGCRSRRCPQLLSHCHYCTQGCFLGVRRLRAGLALWCCVVYPLRNGAFKNLLWPTGELVITWVFRERKIRKTNYWGTLWITARRPITQSYGGIERQVISIFTAMLPTPWDSCVWPLLSAVVKAESLAQSVYSTRSTCRRLNSYQDYSSRSLSIYEMRSQKVCRVTLCYHHRVSTKKTVYKPFITVNTSAQRSAMPISITTSKPMRF